MIDIPSLSAIPHLLSLVLATLPVAYAEIHYRWPGIPSRLFMRQPEIIFDLPHRVKQGKPIPLFLLVKDAHRYPATLQRVRVEVSHPASSQTGRWESEIDRQADQRFRSDCLELPEHLFPQPGRYELVAELDYQCNGRQYTLKQDNYRQGQKLPFRIYVSEHELPGLPGLFWGDLHLHSSYTEDQIEFGAPLSAIRTCAGALGLQFAAVTDHSYDLDDLPGSYKKRDPQLRKWKQFLQECRRLNREPGNVLILPGEEVSCGNRRGQNVHCLVIGCPDFIPGYGDSGEQPLFNRPTLTLSEVHQQARQAAPHTLIAAAHPFETPPRSQRMLLNRGDWDDEDLRLPQLDFWQILNGSVDKTFRRGRSKWIAALLSGRRIRICAGADAHGNFNISRQIVLPFWKMSAARNQLLGFSRTGVFLEDDLSSETLLRALRSGAVSISTGPALRIQAEHGDWKVQIGQELEKAESYSISVKAVSTPEFGEICRVSLFCGNTETAREQEIKLLIAPAGYEFETSIRMDMDAPGYLRAEVYTTQKDSLCLTNPIWIG